MTLFFTYFFAWVISVLMKIYYLTYGSKLITRSEVFIVCFGLCQYIFTLPGESNELFGTSFILLLTGIYIAKLLLMH